MTPLTRPGPAASQGPFETEQAARETPAVRAVHAAFDAGPGAGKMHPHNLAMLTAALDDAGVTLGEHDRRIVSWLAGWEPATVVVVAGLIRRAAAGRPSPACYLTRAEAGIVLEALDVAAEYKRDRAASCPDCDRSPADLCGTCESRLARADDYDALAAKLGGAR